MKEKFHQTRSATKKLALRYGQPSKIIPHSYSISLRTGVSDVGLEARLKWVTEEYKKAYKKLSPKEKKEYRECAKELNIPYTIGGISDVCEYTYSYCHSGIFTTKLFGAVKEMDISTFAVKICSGLFNV